MRVPVDVLSPGRVLPSALFARMRSGKVVPVTLAALLTAGLGAGCTSARSVDPIVMDAAMGHDVAIDDAPGDVPDDEVVSPAMARATMFRPAMPRAWSICRSRRRMSTAKLTLMGRRLWRAQPATTTVAGPASRTARLPPAA